ncbi:MAG TPA: cytochrome c oxidase subunit 3 [Patescibacteria group bacterium]|nr:cytochrome c oxidase subunit 3 [Patescibacteria group bacterium]
MPGTTIVDDLEISSNGGAGGSASVPPPERRGGGGGGGRGGGDGESQPGPKPRRVSRRIYYTGIWLALAGILMFFMSLVSAYIVRKSSADWRAVVLPRIVWLNTGVLLISSLALEAAHRAWEREDAKAFRSWWAMATGLGVLFLAGQWVAWRELAAAGVYLATNPSSSFFYLLTAAHGLHVVGGLAALGYVLSRGWVRLHASGGVAPEVAGIYWHFMDGLWVFLLLVLTMGR